MGTPHKHRDVIISWANGEEVEYRSVHTKGEWISIPIGDTPQFNSNTDYRIKPKRVKKAGWVNIYPDKYETYGLNFYITKGAADLKATEARVACISIEWEEEV